MRFRSKTRIVYTLAAPCVALAFFVMGAGCDPVRTAPPGRTGIPSLPSIAEERSSLQPSLVRESLVNGVEHVSYSFSTTSRARVELYGFPQETYRFRLAAAEKGKLLNVWRDEASANVVAGINAMYFLEDDSPAGFLVTEDVESRAHPFDWDVSALLVIDEHGRALIRSTTAEPTDLGELTQAAQSYPLLVLNGEPMLKTDSGKRSRRSMIGIDEDDRIWIGVLVDGDASLYRLGQLLMELDISWKQVLNLDGGGSSGMFIRGVDDAYYPSFTGIPSVVFVEAR